MNNQFMNELSVQFVMDLYRVRIRAEKSRDAKAIESLKLHYPELFSEDFEDFIKNAKIATAYLDQKYDKRFSRIFSPDFMDDLPDSLH